jgi:hypothetical protein
MTCKYIKYYYILLTRILTPQIHLQILSITSETSRMGKKRNDAKYDKILLFF